MEKKTWVFAQPFQDLLALVDTQVVANDMNRGDVIRDLGIQIFQEADELHLSFSPEAPAVNVACPGVKSGKEVERSLAGVFVFDPYGFLGFRRFGRLLSSPGLQRGFFIKAEDYLVGMQRAGVQFAGFPHLGIECVIAGCLVPKPHVMSPRF